MSSPPIPPSSQPRTKRQRSRSRSPTAGPSGPRSSSPPPSSLPPSSPPAPFSDFGDEADVGDDAEVEMRQMGRAREGDDDEDEDGEDLFNERMMEDYDANDALDTYSQADLDDRSSVAEMTRGERLAAERAMDRRDRGLGGRRAGRRDHMPAFLQSDDEDMDGLGEGPLAGINTRRRRRQYDERMDEDDAGEEEEMSLEHLGDVKAASIAEWVSIDSVRRAVQKHFRSFLMTYVDENGQSVYGQRIKHLGEINSESLEVSFLHLAQSRPILAYFLANSPQPMLALFDEVALEAILLYYPSYDNIHSEIHVRITELPTSLSLRDLRQSNLNCLVRVSGVVTRRTGVFPQLKYVKFDCGKCGATLGPFFQDTNKELKISFCSACESRGPFSVNSEQTVYRNYQKMTLQESPGSVPAGRLPRHREVVLLWDLIDMAKPGEEIEVTGIYRNNFDASLNTKNGFPVFSTVLEANHINKKEDLFAAVRLTEEDEKMIRSMAKDERIAKRIVKSIAPSIYGHDDIKTAIALSLFGGVPKDINRKHRIRGDINVLLLGDPGTAKSQFLKYVEKTASRAVFTTGQGASAVGLTASVRKDPITREWTLEGGALVLADKGHCLIDEFDKMNDADRTSIHEAMEQQSISISKAGIVTSLQARCAIIAAANPIRGRYNPTIPFQQNVELTEPILSRFDVLCVVKDAVDPVQDEMLAQFVVGSHLRSHPQFNEARDEVNVTTSVDADIIPQDVLRKYIMYSKEHIRPKLHQLDQDKLARLYADLRRESLATGSFPITVRHLESMIRMSEASAKMHLREYVRSDDIDLAIQVAVGSFVNAQKMSIKKTLERGFRKYVHQATDHEELLSFLLGQIVKELSQQYRLQRGTDLEKVQIKLNQLEKRAKELEIYDVGPFLKSQLFRTNGYKLIDSEGQGKVIEKVFTRG
ncbi:minichromosome maintenance protein 2 [Kwoniella mangroviensis CBS 10435]|uniref:DNA replication licensing factor MCM2 n=2 Tax=Kwoniella mangrovensis TaxID=463800 RepID=A0A1B9IQF3_9TREE|nr:minichromosome maintenance protein 2 [Kwoniella mangroviensis CBS 10435]OCF75681.1 minichromosome maintenance protein 2 [Kwoniella mangroviensis CBS 8886]